MFSKYNLLFTDQLNIIKADVLQLKATWNCNTSSNIRCSKHGIYAYFFVLNKMDNELLTQKLIMHQHLKEYNWEILDITTQTHYATYHNDDIYFVFYCFKPYNIINNENDLNNNEFS